MKELKQEIAELERSCKLAQDELQKGYEGRKEHSILRSDYSDSQ